MPGDALIALCKAAQQELLLVAPFIKVAVLERLLIEIPDEVTLRCVTRWFPHEIASGVSDLEIWPLFKERANSSLWLRLDLHAKYYRVDQQCLIGSANLTAAALGWRQPANLELLLPYSAEASELRFFEETLFTQAVVVNDSIYQQMLEAVQHLPKPPSQPDYPLESSSQEDGLSGDDEDSKPRELRENGVVYGQTPGQEWFPQTRHPEDLYKAYANQWERLTSATQIAAVYDLWFLAIPPGLDSNGFLSYVGAMLLQQPVVQAIDELAATPQRFGAVKKMLAVRYKHQSDFDSSYAWQTLMRWLLFFLPRRYSVSTPNYSEVFRRLP
jgi:hypothetical protein